MKLFGKLLLLLLLVAGMAQAQLTTATIVGNVQDSTGAVIPSAQVTATNQETQFTRTVTSGADGAYRLDFLPVGTYTVKIEAAGFQTRQQQGVVLTLNAEIHVDAALSIGEASQTIDVTSNEIPLVETTTSSLGRTVTNVEVDNLPIVNRNVYDLLTLTPGVQASSNVNTLGYPQQVVYINGGTDNFVGSVSYYLDGGLNMTFIRNTGNVLPNPDALREFNVQTNNYNALYGRMSSGLVNVVTKSGTNKVHGSIFYFHRETNFAAAPAFSAPGPKAPLHRHQFGATIGGPIWKDKTFFFGSYAGLRQITSSILNGALVPTAAQRAGNFGENLPTSGTPATCTSNTSSIVFVVCDPVTRTPRPGNVLAASQIDPTVQRLLARIPLPNATGVDTATGRTTYRWQGTIANTLNTDEFLLKIDHQIGQHRIQGMYFNTAGNQQQSPGGNIDWSRQNFVYRQQNGNLSDTWAISPNVVNQVWLNYTRMIGGRINTPQLSLSDFGSSFGIQGAPMLPQLAVSGYFTATQAISGPVTGTNFYSFRDVLSLTRGKHTLAFGAETSLNKDLQYTYLNNYGVFAFQRSTTARTGAEISDFVAGLPATMNQDSPVQAADNSWFTGVFLQDDYRIFRNLTLNLGLRWDVQTPPTDPKNRQSAFIPGQKSTVYPTAPTGLVVVGDQGINRGIVSTRWHHVSPRVGFAWDPFGNGRTAVRGAFGLFFGSVSGNEWNGVSNFQPFAVRNRYAFIKSMTDIYGDPRSFPNGNPYPYVYDPKNPRPFITPAQVQGIDLAYQWPYVYQTNFSIQQQVTNSLAVSMSYVGSFSHDVPFAPDVNYPVYATAANPVNGVTTSNANNFDSRRPYNPLGFGIINVIQSKQRANYHGLQITGEKRLSNQFSVKAFYTWSKTLSTASVNNSGAVIGTAQDFNRMQDEYGSSDTDIRHQANISAIWKPVLFTGSPRYVRETINGWTISGIAQFNAGTPFTVTTGTDNNFDGYTTDRANLSGKADVGITRGRSRADKIAAYFNPAAFCSYTGSTATCPAGVGPAGLDGTTRRNNFFGPGYRVVNAALFRDFGVYEAVKFQLRAEVNNVFNLVNLGNPTTSLNSGNFGKITGASGVPRQIQIGGRILF
ncbi:carboxypeptidase regulatory-like domain-containing protein [Terriglobus tenax]|uniref:carboxypeptidase regulatory-like domain-containing protein n=1 Tax=Terriglobus tenax TaxID=1111115 RepID=UPI0021DF5C15|nr:carboxypeptidase regulatory-like domain-containing protein [Terriglobus tenax]